MAMLSTLTEQSLIAVTKPHHGLGNRVRVVLGARSLARLEERRFFYVWDTGPKFGVRFDELWNIDDPVLSGVSARLLSLRYPFHDQTLDWLTDAERERRVLQVRTAHALHLPSAATPWESELQALSPTTDIVNRVRRFFYEHLSGSPYVGVMVRTHPISHADTLRESPVSWYVDRMAEIRRMDPGIRFFISADTTEAQRTIVNAVPGCHALENKGPYNSRQALLSSVVDLYLLASSTHILAPHFSSFPELAQKLAGPSLALETSMNGVGGTITAASFTTRVADPTRPHVRS